MYLPGECYSENASGIRQSIVEPISEKKMIEKVQRRATRLIPSLCKLAYYERLKILKLPTLEYRKKCGRMTGVQSLNCDYDVTATGMFTKNERNSHLNPGKLITRKSRTCLRSSFFTKAAINDWNSLPVCVFQRSNGFFVAIFSWPFLFAILF